MIVQAYILFGIRLLSAILLLTFLGLIAWIAYQDLKASSQLAAQDQRSHGYLRVIGSDNGDLADGTLFPLLLVTTIGRAQGSTIMLDDSYVSSEHALLTQRANRWWLEDLDSRNGTLLNDMPLTETVVISAGDIITIGSTHLKVEPGSPLDFEQPAENESVNDSD